VEFSSSPDDREDGPAADDRMSGGTGVAGGGASDAALSLADAAAMAELLAGEHPQIVAAALARLGEEQSAAVFAALPPEVQGEALERLGNLAPADEEAVQDIESQLQRRLQQRREHQARAAACAELVRKMLACTPPAQRTYLLDRMAAKDPVGRAPQTPRPLGIHPPDLQRAARHEGQVAQQALNLATAMRRAERPAADAIEPLEDRSEELMALSDAALVAALRASKESTVLRALAASGEAFVTRVANMLPRRQAKQLRRLLRNLGPTRLADLHEAQHELLHRAYESTERNAA
jgi:flagellar motor switch protein FliG